MYVCFSEQRRRVKHLSLLLSAQKGCMVALPLLQRRVENENGALPSAILAWSSDEKVFRQGNIWCLSRNSNGKKEEHHHKRLKSTRRVVRPEEVVLFATQA